MNDEMITAGTVIMMLLMKFGDTFGQAACEAVEVDALRQTPTSGDVDLGGRT